MSEFEELDLDEDPLEDYLAEEEWGEDSSIDLQLDEEWARDEP